MNVPVTYIATIRLPTEKAHGLQIMHTCSSLSEAGLNIKLVIPDRKNSLTQNPFAYYDLKRNFEIKKVKSRDFISMRVMGRLGYLATSLSFFHSLKRNNILKHDRVFYTRDPLIAYWLGKGGYRYVYEIHTLPAVMRRFHLLALKTAASTVVISNGLKKELTRRGLPTAHIHIIPDAVDIKKFNVSLSKEMLRKDLSLPIKEIIVMYTGHLYTHKGVETLLRAAKKLNDGVRCVFVGGTKQDQDRLLALQQREKITNVEIRAHIEHELIPKYLAAADILVIPNSGTSQLSAVYASPMKLFEYMAAAKPIVASDVPALREVLSETSALFVRPDSPEALKTGIAFLIENPQTASALAATAYEHVRNYTWDKRAEKLIHLIDGAATCEAAKDV